MAFFVRLRRLRGGRSACRGDRDRKRAPSGEDLVGDPDRDLLRLLLYAATVFSPGRHGRLHWGQRWQSAGGIAEDVRRGIGSLLVTFPILNSRLANATRCRTHRRDRSTPSGGRGSSLAHSGRSIDHRTPAVAIDFQAIIGIIIAVGLSLNLGNQFPAVPGPLNTSSPSAVQSAFPLRRCTWP